MSKFIPSIPGPNAVNMNGGPVDVLATLRFKKELAAEVVPFMLQMIEDTREGLLVSGEPASPELDNAEQMMRDIAESFGVDPNPED